MGHLSREVLSKLKKDVKVPSWSHPAVGIVHLGLGNFHRTHQAWYTENALLTHGGNWAICGVTLQGSTKKRDGLNSQDNLYTLVQRDGEVEEFRVMQILSEVLALPDDLPALKDILSSTNVKIVSLTITEKGYCKDPSSGGLDTSHLGILHDLNSPDLPSTALGVLVWGMQARRLAKMSPFTVLSCDNISDNGLTTSRLVLALAREYQTRDPAYMGLADWIEQHAAFPSTMVDRISPATTDDDRAAVSQVLGCEDASPVICERFSQWVIEDRFPEGRPHWEEAGVQLVSDVAPFERAKLRMLNGSHSAMAYLSVLADFPTIEAAINFPPMKSYISAMMTEEVMPTLSSLPKPFDIASYRDSLLHRFSNPSLKHKTLQIAQDGSQKMPLRILEPICDLVSLNLPFKRLALAFAAWILFLRGRSDAGTEYDIVDPLASKLDAVKRVAIQHGDPETLLHAVLSLQTIVPEGLRDNPTFRNEVVQALGELQAGVLQVFSNQERT